MVKASDVKALNAKIERLNTARTKAETQKELLGDSLERELKSYQEKYGKVLKGKTFAETVSLINKELESISKSVTEEYELKSKIVEAVENQDYESAYKLLGVEPSKDTQEELQKETVAESTQVQEQEVQSDDTEDLEKLLTELEGESDETPVETEEETKEDVSEKPIKLRVSEIPTPQPTNSLKLNIGELSLEDEEEVGLPDLGQQDFGFGNALQGTQFKV